jgi:hypothetical protein
MIESVQEMIEGTAPLWQWLAITAAGAVPFIESYLAAALGVAAGVPPPIAIPAAITGNLLSMLGFVAFGDKIGGARRRTEKPMSKRRRRFKEAFDAYGIAVVSLIGQTILPSQVTSMAMVTFGARKDAVIFWQSVSIVLWGVVFGALAALGLRLFQ